jgi:hypothetical protein
MTLWLMVFFLAYRPPKAAPEGKPGKFFFKSYHSQEIPKPMKWRLRYTLEQRKAKEKTK